jgi:hypothetical protein
MINGIKRRAVGARLLTLSIFALTDAEWTTAEEVSQQNFDFYLHPRTGLAPANQTVSTPFLCTRDGEIIVTRDIRLPSYNADGQGSFEWFYIMSSYHVEGCIIGDRRVLVGSFIHEEAGMAIANLLRNHPSAQLATLPKTLVIRKTETYEMHVMIQTNNPALYGRLYRLMGPAHATGNYAGDFPIMVNINITLGVSIDKNLDTYNSHSIFRKMDNFVNQASCFSP